jgi:hypothetical protein
MVDDRNDDANGEVENFDFLGEVGETPDETKSEDVLDEKPKEEIVEEEDSTGEVADESTDEEVKDDTEEAEDEEAGTSEDTEEEEDDDDDDSFEDSGTATDPKDDVIRQLQERLDKLEKGDKAPEPKKEEPPALPEDLQQRILGDLDIDDVTSDPKLFMQVMQNALTVGRDMTFEHVMRRIPDLVMTQTRGYQELMTMTRKFYKEHKDLRPYKNTVVAAANEVHSEHPDWEYSKVMSEAAVRARKTIGITRKQQSQNPPGKTKATKQKPAFAKTPKAKKVKEQVSKLQQDINQTLFD